MVVAKYFIHKLEIYSKIWYILIKYGRKIYKTRLGKAEKRA